MLTHILHSFSAPQPHGSIRNGLWAELQTERWYLAGLFTNFRRQYFFRLKQTCLFKKLLSTRLTSGKVCLFKQTTKKTKRNKQKAVCMGGKVQTNIKCMVPPFHIWFFYVSLNRAMDQIAPSSSDRKGYIFLFKLYFAYLHD